MLSLATLDLLLSISESELIEEMVVGLLASPQLALFFEKFPRIKRALMKDIPGWKQNLQQRIHEAKVPAGLADEFYLAGPVCSDRTQRRLVVARPQSAAGRDLHHGRSIHR